MTVGTSAASTTVDGDGVTTVFSYAFTIPGNSATDQSNAQLVFIDTSGLSHTLTRTQWSITGVSTPNAPSSGGTFTFTTQSNPAPSGSQLMLSRIVPYTQGVVLTGQGTNLGASSELADDLQVMQIQQLVGQGARYRGSWVSGGVAYNLSDIIQDGSAGNNTQNLYACVAANTSSATFNTDLTAGDWTLVYNFQAVSTSASQAATSASMAAASATAAATSASQAATSATAAAASATSASTSASQASTSAAAAAVSATSASTFAAALIATSTTSLTVGTGTQTLTIQSGKQFSSGEYVIISSVAVPTNYMHGQVTNYSGATLTASISDIGGSGTTNSWNINLSGTQGPTGATGSVSSVAVSGGTGINISGSPITTSGTITVSVNAGTGANQIPQLDANGHLSQAVYQQHGQCRLNYVSATQIVLSPFSGQFLQIAGSPCAVPSAGVTTSTAGLSATTLYYCYATSSSTNVNALELSTTSYTASSTAGNIGVQVKTGDDNRSLVGMVYTNASAQFTSSLVASYFNRQLKANPVTVIGAARTTTSTGFSEISTSLRNTFLIWSGDCPQINLVGFMSVTVSSVISSAIGIDGTTPEVPQAVLNIQNAGGTLSYYPFSVPLAKTGLVEGNHYATLLGKVTTGIGTWDDGTNATSINVMVRG